MHLSCMLNFVKRDKTILVASSPKVSINSFEGLYILKLDSNTVSAHYMMKQVFRNNMAPISMLFAW